MPIDQGRAGQSSSAVRRVLLIVIAVLALLTAYQLYQSRPAYQLQLFNTSAGWGYDVLNRGDVLIHQPVIPGAAGNRGFVSEDQARQVGELAINKIKKGRGLPTITQDELREMHITIP